MRRIKDLLFVLAAVAVAGLPVVQCAAAQTWRNTDGFGNAVTWNPEFAEVRHEDDAGDRSLIVGCYPDGLLVLLELSPADAFPAGAEVLWEWGDEELSAPVKDLSLATIATGTALGIFFPEESRVLARAFSTAGEVRMELSGQQARWSTAGAREAIRRLPCASRGGDR